jgi:hypothetical protein
MGAVMYFSLRSLSVPVGGSLTLTLIPLVLGTLNLFTGFAYSMSAIMLIIACGSNFLGGYHFQPGDVHNIVAAWLK